MSKKRKTRIVWLRYEVRDDARSAAEFANAEHKLFRARCVESRGQYTNEDVIGMVKAAIREARKLGRLTFTQQDIDAAIEDGAAVSVTNCNSDTPPRVEITWPVDRGYLCDRDSRTDDDSE